MTLHIPALDGVRGLAILGVVASHLFPGTPHSAIERQTLWLFRFGATGVDLFFVLSGFLITGILFDSLRDPSFFKKFYVRRALRIFPLYYGVLIAFGVAALLCHLDFHHELLSLAVYLQNTWLIAQPIEMYAGPTALPLSHFWSLAIEEQFYLVWPLCVFILRKQKKLLLFSAASILLCPILRYWQYMSGVDYQTVHTSTLLRADSLLAGAGLALLLRTRLHDKTLQAGRWVFCLGAVMIALLRAISSPGMAPRWTFFLMTLNYSGLALASVGVIALALREPAVIRLFSVGVLRQFGKYSYGIYVLHLILFGYLDLPIRGLIGAHLTSNRAAITAVSGLVILMISYGCAYVSYRFFERRFLHLKRYFDYRRHSETEGPVTQSFSAS